MEVLSHRSRERARKQEQVGTAPGALARAGSNRLSCCTLRHGVSRVTSTEVTLRFERPDDEAALGDLITAAFVGKPYAEGDEADLLVALRRAAALTVSLVADLRGSVVGQAAFSPARGTDPAQRWYALGPVAVLPSHQGAGIGTRLVREGLQSISNLGAEGCIVVGDPAYYTRFGFTVSPENAPRGQPASHFMVKVFGQRQPSGPIHLHPAFGGGA